MRKSSKFEIRSSKFDAFNFALRTSNFALTSGLRTSHFGLNSALRTSHFGLFFFLLFFIPGKVSAQHLLSLDDETFFLNNIPHSAVKPYVDLDVMIDYRASGSRIDPMEQQLENPIPGKSGFFMPRYSWQTVYSKYETAPDSPKPNLQQDFAKHWNFVARPVYDLEAGQDLRANRTLLTTAGGVVINTDYKEKFGIELRFVSGISVLPAYQDSIARVTGVMPGWGDRAYPMGNSKYAFQHFSGNMIWRPSRNFNLQIGRDKHFWGDGYRSLFLSDLSAPYPYLQMQTTIWKLQYTSMFAWMQDWTNSTGSARDFRSKYGTFHYLSFNAAKWINLSIFESVIWQGTDENRTRWFDPNYLDPLVFFRPVEYSLGSSDNAMLGLALKISFNENNQFYSQIILDEFYLKEIKNWNQHWWGNKQGIQMGYKCFNFGTVKNLFMQMELNVVRPYTYSHGSPQQNYSNAGMPLAHPLGANFAELFGMLSYQWKGLRITGKLIAARYGADSPGTDYGQNIFLSYNDRTGMDPAHANLKDYGHVLFSGTHTNLFYVEFKTAYIFNTKFPLRAEFTAGARSENNVNVRKTSSYVVAGLVIPLWRANRDY